MPENQKEKPVITLIGAGSRVFSFKMCTDICQTPDLQGAEVRLVDIDEERLAMMEKLFKLVNDSTGMELSISGTTDRRKALPGSDFVIVSVSKERIDRWETDLNISRKHGIVELQGECGGPGGLSLTLRNVPLIIDIAGDIETYAPEALLINFTNPMTRVCHAINRYTQVKAVGLCHSLLGAERRMSELLKRDVIVTGAGINHFNWIFGAYWRDTNEDAWEQVTEAFRMDASPDYRYSRELFEVFERILSAGDGHVSDFVHHWRGDHDGLNARYNVAPKSMDRYRENETVWKKRIAGYLNGSEDPMKNVDGLSGEGAIPIICAVYGLSDPYNEIAVNIPNRGYIANIPDNTLVEVPARISRDTIEGVSVGCLPLGVRSLIARQLDIWELAVEAAVEGSYSKALQALAIDPIIRDLEVAKNYLNDILKAHRDVLSRFF